MNTVLSVHTITVNPVRSVPTVTVNPVRSVPTVTVNPVRSVHTVTVNPVYVELVSGVTAAARSFRVYFQIQADEGDEHSTPSPERFKEPCKSTDRSQPAVTRGL